MLLMTEGVAECTNPYRLFPPIQSLDEEERADSYFASCIYVIGSYLGPNPTPGRFYGASVGGKKELLSRQNEARAK